MIKCISCESMRILNLWGSTLISSANCRAQSEEHFAVGPKSLRGHLAVLCAVAFFAAAARNDRGDLKQILALVPGRYEVIWRSYELSRFLPRRRGMTVVT